jgi:hypothetical protein
MVNFPGVKMYYWIVPVQELLQMKFVVARMKIRNFSKESLQVLYTKYKYNKLKSPEVRPCMMKGGQPD